MQGIGRLWVRGIPVKIGILANKGTKVSHKFTLVTNSRFLTGICIFQYLVRILNFSKNASYFNLNVNVYRLVKCSDFNKQSHLLLLEDRYELAFLF